MIALAALTLHSPHLVRPWKDTGMVGLQDVMCLYLTECALRLCEDTIDDVMVQP